MHRHGIGDAAELRRRSVDAAWFWPAAVQDLDLRFRRPWAQLVDASEGPEWARWFDGAELNLVDSCLDRWADAKPDAAAVIWDGESGDRRRVSWAQLRALTDGAARALRGLGVGSRDRVGVYLPLAPEAVAVFYALAKLGAVAVPIFSGFGKEAVAERLRHADARVLVTADGFQRAGAVVPMKEVADAAIELAPQVKRVLVLRRPGAASPRTERDAEWDDLVDRRSDPVQAVAVSPEHPLLLIYTSGSSGRPKGALHTHAGLLVTVAKDSGYHLDLAADDTLCWITDLGWIMGPWAIVAAGVQGATLCLLEGAPTAPAQDRIWRLVADERISVLGIGPTLVRALAAADAEPRDVDLSSLRVLGATGEPMNPAPYDWLFERVGGGRCPVINFSGGSEVGGCLLSPMVVEEIARSSLGGPALGMDVAVVDSDGRPLGAGQVGELVCRRPWPGMTRGLWRDRERYLDTYWRRIPGMWVQGDWASFDERGHWYLQGRSDDTLNVAGQRIGPAEVEGALTDHPAVAEAAAVGMPHDVKGTAIWCFVLPAGDEPPDERELSDRVAERVGKPFRPERIVWVADLPRTRSGKLLRRVIRATALDDDPGDLSSLDNEAAIFAVREALSSS